jgi:predicted ester cyclase
MRRTLFVFLSAVCVVALTSLTSLTALGAETTPEQNKATAKKFYDEVMNTGKIELADQFITADAVDHELMPGQKDPVLVLKNVKALIAELHAAFPDMKVVVKDMLAEGDKVVARVQLTGTHKGEYNGIAATGKSISFEFIDIIRFANGKCVEHWGISDEVGLMQQLQITPAVPPGAK